MTRLARVEVVATGGTIDNRRPAAGEVGSRSGQQVERLVDELVRLGEVAVDVRVSRWGSIPGPALTPDDFVDLATHVEARMADGVTGCVVTLGTDMMEECGYAVTCLLRLSAPIVLTGAICRVGEPGSDAAGNLLTAIELAARPELTAVAPLIAFGARAVSAVVATKVDPLARDAFGSEVPAVEGVLSEGHFYRCRPVPAGHHVGMPAGPLPTVEIAWAHGGMTGDQVEGAAARGHPIVLGGTGGGHVPPSVVTAVGAASADGVPVVYASRTHHPVTLRQTYAGPGSERELIEAGAVPAGLISAVKARLRLQLGLGAGWAVDDLFPVDAAGPLARS